MTLVHRLRLLFRKGRLDAEMTEEMRHHVELQTELNLRAGMSPDEARYAALRQFGNVAVIQEQAREARSLRWLDDLGQDFRFALRSLRKSPGFTAVAVLSLALGIGANTAIFSVINAVFLRSLPVADPSSLVVFSHQGKSGAPDKPAGYFNFPLYEFLRDGNRSFSGLLAFSPTHLRVRRDAETAGISAQWVSVDYFSTLGVSAQLGRPLTAEDVAHPAVVVLSDRFWRREYGADPTVIGKTLFISGKPATIVGVAPAGFTGLLPGTPIDLTLLLAAQPGFQPERGNLLELGRGPTDEPVPSWEFYLLGRLKAGCSSPQAEAETTVLLRQWAVDRRASQAYIEDSFYRMELAPGGKGLDGLQRRFSAPLRVLAGIVGGVFLIAGANIANLLLARVVTRRHELAVRAAIGASRSRLARQLLTESLTLTALGGAGGILFGWWGSSFLAGLIATGRVPVELDVQPDARVLGFTFAASVLAGIGVGILPALRGSTAATLKEAGLRGGHRAGPWNLGQALVAGQLALSLCLLVATGLFAANLRRIAAIDPGFQAENLLSISFDWAGAGYSRAQMMAFVQRAVEEAEAVPGVRSASAAHIEPLGQQQSQRWFSVREAVPGGATSGVVDLNVVSGDYFRTMQLPIERGRSFDTRDTDASPQVAVISETLAKSYFGEADPVGRPAWIARDTTGTPLLIVGVVHDSKQRDLREAPLRLLYLPATQSTAWEMNLIVRTAGNPTVLAADLRRALSGVSPDVAVREITTPRDQMERSLLEERLLATLAGFFGPLALLLAAIGLYGLLAHNVTQRTREIGIRVALGARHSQVLWLVLGEGMLLVGVSVVTGLAAASALAGVMRRFLFSISPGDPATLLTAVAVLGLVALLACWLPARRAAKVDPVVALRAD